MSKLANYAFLLVEIILFMIFCISVNCSFRLSSSSWSYNSLHNASQYSVSSTSLTAILNLWIKSALLSAFWASLTFAPIEVELLKSWFASGKFLLDWRIWQYLAALTAKANVFKTIGFSSALSLLMGGSNLLISSFANYLILEKKMGKHLLSHRYNLLPLLRSHPGGVQRELVVKDLPGTKVRKKWKCRLYDNKLVIKIQNL